jgi:tRNA modification GTPase
MEKENLTDTIAAISTALGEGGIGIVRISGRGALKIADRIFISKSKEKPSAFKTYTTHYGKIIDGGRVIDEVILTLMRSPNSYTREDVVEINCHGGIAAVRAVLKLVLGHGARLADPGEFTRRAFLNGRIDLSQAEAVLDIIRAKTDYALKVGEEQLRGGLSLKINQCREKLLNALSYLEAGIDFPEEESLSPGLNNVVAELSSAAGILKELLDSSSFARILREGLLLVICGKPNTGKSSLLNAILKEERSIVTPVAGTTRDTIEEVLDIKGIPVRMVDTAGILRPRNLVEKKALERSKKAIASADLIILLFDGSRRLSAEDFLLMNKLKSKRVIAAINKIDLRQKIEREKIASFFGQAVSICAKKPKNIPLLEQAILKEASCGLGVSHEAAMVGNLRHVEKLRKAQKNVAQALKSLDNSLAPEFVAQEIKEALDFLDVILGKKFNADLLDRIFSEFCIGK